MGLSRWFRTVRPGDAATDARGPHASSLHDAQLGSASRDAKDLGNGVRNEPGGVHHQIKQGREARAQVGCWACSTGRLLLLCCPEASG